jgi:hypothetical protein
VFKTVKFLSILVYGALLGRQKGRFIELCTSFEIKMNQDTNDEQTEDIDLEFLNTNISQCKKRRKKWFKMITKN